MKFNNMKDYEEVMKDLYDLEVSDELRNEYEEFINNRDFEIDVSEDCEDNLLIINNEEYYWCVERGDEVRFVKLDNDEIENYMNE